jgi:hypothetical protein
MVTDKMELRALVLKALRAHELDSAHAYARQLKYIETNEHLERHHELFGALESVDHLKLVFASKPQILKSVKGEALEHLRFAAGTALLLGATHFHEYLPADFSTGLAMDNDSAVRMLLFRVSHEHDMAQAKTAGAEKVRLVAANWADNFSGVCENCKALHGKQWSLKRAPEIPLKHCMSKCGCRCRLVTIDKD